MALDQRKYEHKHQAILRDVRPLWTRIGDALSTTTYSTAIFVMLPLLPSWPMTGPLAFADVLLIFLGLYFWWLSSRNKALAFKLPLGANIHGP